MTARSPGSTVSRRRGGADAAAKAQAYARNKETTRRISMEKSRSGRDIGPLPKIRNRHRRKKCERDLRLFCETYMPATFPLKWSSDHLEVLSLVQRAVLTGGLFAVAMPRGSGKTSICEAGCLWAILYGHRRFVVLIGADAGAAEIMLESLKSELEHNELLAEDFPEACFPIRRMEGIYQRAAGQLLDGKPTEMEWTQFGVVMPRIKGSPSSGSVFVVAGLLGGLRGLKRKTPDGEQMRPDLALVDDPQTDESARSPSQSANRERILKGAILGLAGPGKRIAGLAAVTVVEKGDLAEKLLDRELNPTWQGVRMRLMRSLPTASALWDEYARIRREAQADGLEVEAVAARCNRFYLDNRAAMDEGADAAWEHRKEPDEISATQHAMNLKIDRGDAAFFAEYQNEPMARDQVADGLEIRAAEFVKRLNGLPRGVIPHAAQYLTAFVDIQQACLYWMVVAWGDDFTGWIVDYGTWPDQQRTYFRLRDVRRTLLSAFPGAAIEGAIRGGLDKLVPWICGREWKSEDGAVRKVDRCLIDVGWGDMSDVVYSFCRATPHSGIVMPSIGRYVSATNTPFSEYKRQRGDRVGLHWRVPITKPGAQPVRRVLFDTNWWKTIVAVRATTAVGDSGALTVFGKPGNDHTMLADQLASEYRQRVTGHDRTVDIWTIRSPGLDNHLFDGVVGCAVGASMCGAIPPGITSHVRERRRVSFSELRAKVSR